MQMASQREHQHGMPPQFIPRSSSLDQYTRLMQNQDAFPGGSNPAMSYDTPPPVRPLFDNFVRPPPPNTLMMNGAAGDFPFNMSSPNLQYMHHNNPTNFPVPVDNRSATPDPERTKKVSYPFAKPAYQTHRRVRSGDSAVWESNRQNISMSRQHGFASPQNSNSRLMESYPSDMRNPIMFSNCNQFIERRFDNENAVNNAPSYFHPLHVNIPEEEKPDGKQQHYLRQVNSFMKLNQAIENSERFRESLEADVRKMEEELNSRSAVEKNPTEKDFSRLKDENEYLMKEIREMQAELDRLNILFPGDPIQENLNIRSNPQHTFPVDVPFTASGPDNTLATIPTNNQKITTPITTQPSTRTRLVSGVSYENVDINLRPRPPDTTPPVFTPMVSEVPPIPPRIPTNNPEKWRCPKCTFDNLLLSYCEICGEFRPAHLSMVKSS